MRYQTFADTSPDVGTMKNPLVEPDVAAMGVEGRTEILLDQALARMASSQHDVFLELPGNHMRDRFALRLDRGGNPVGCRDVAASRQLFRGFGSRHGGQSAIGPDSIQSKILSC